MKLRYVCGLMLFVSLIAACAGRAGGRPMSPRPSPAALATTDVEWSKRVPTASLWPASARHLQLIITAGNQRGQHYAWFITNGTDVVAAYNVRDVELGDLIIKAVTDAQPTVAMPGASASFGVLGSIWGPGPPRPPHAFPEPYVVRVLDQAWRMNREALAGDHQTAAP